MKRYIPSGEKVRKLVLDRSVISWLAMSVSVTSFYLTSFDPARITVQPGQSFQIWYNDLDELQIDYPLSFANTGAQIGSIVSMAVVIESPTMKEALLCKWGGTKTYHDGWHFASREQPVSLLPKATTDAMENFGCGSAGRQLKILPGDYKLTFLVWSSNSASYSGRASTTVNISKPVAARIEGDLAQGRSNGTWIESDNMSGHSRYLDKDELEKLLSNG